jgi:Aerobic-type carbon monoxide dehydrogenase, middle subunit CoxM/CutM homologs
MPVSITHRTLLQPRSLADALKMLRDEGPLVPMAGCTDLFVSLNFGTLKDTRFLNLWTLDALRTIEMRNDLLVIGALATHSDLIRSPLVRRRIPMLAAAAREVGGVQIQNRGTLGGNVANASPAGDTLPVLSAAEAVVVLRNAGASRRVPFAAFYTGYRQSVRRPDELIVGFEIPAIGGEQWFRKVGTRAAQAISKVVVAAVAPSASTRDRRRAGGSGRPDGAVRIALGSVGPNRRASGANRRGAGGRRLPRRCAAHSRRGDRADRRHSLHGRVPPARRVQPPRAVWTDTQRR